MIDTAVIPVAGKGTRVLPFTKEIPKEMLPIYHENGMKPIVQIVFEQLFDAGIRNYIFIVGKGKRAIEDHFTPDDEYIHLLKNKENDQKAEAMKEFYSKIENSKIAWITQSKPRGFGDAVQKVAPYVGDRPFLVHAGDACIIGKKTRNIILRICNYFESETADCVLATMIVPEIEKLRHYGVVTLDPNKSNRITKIVEKPHEPESKFAVMPIYAFNKTIFETLRSVKPDRHSEIQLTDGIANMISEGYKVFSCQAGEEDSRLDVGTPESYRESLNTSFTFINW